MMSIQVQNFELTYIPSETHRALLARKGLVVSYGLIDRRVGSETKAVPIVDSSKRKT